MEDEKLAQLQEALDQAKEDLFIAQTDLAHARTENIALKNFIQNLYESCEGLENVELSLQDVLKNLMQNIRTFGQDHNIRL